MRIAIEEVYWKRCADHSIGRNWNLSDGDGMATEQASRFRVLAVVSLDVVYGSGVSRRDCFGGLCYGLTYFDSGVELYTNSSLKEWRFEWNGSSTLQQQIVSTNLANASLPIHYRLSRVVDMIRVIVRHCSHEPKFRYHQVPSTVYLACHYASERVKTSKASILFTREY